MQDSANKTYADCMSVKSDGISWFLDYDMFGVGRIGGRGLTVEEAKRDLLNNIADARAYLLGLEDEIAGQLAQSVAARLPKTA